MKSVNAASVLKTVAKLRDERKAHEQAIAEIDGVFAELAGVTPGAKPGPKPAKRKPGRPKGSKNVAKRKRGRPKGSKTVAKRGPGRPKGSKNVAKKKPGRPKKAKPAAAKPATKKKSGGTKQKAAKKPELSTTGLVMQMLKAGGKAGARGSEISKAWVRMGGKRTTMTSALVVMRKAGKIKKAKVRGANDSVYRLV